jgi:hypothetical protein
MSIYLQLNLAKVGKLSPNIVQILNTANIITKTADGCTLYSWSIIDFYELEIDQLYDLHEFIEDNLHSVRFLNLTNDDSQEVIGYLPLIVTVEG